MKLWKTGPSPSLTPAQLAAMAPTRSSSTCGPAEQFAAGHIPGAVHLDLWGLSLIDTSEAPLRAFMWMIGHLFSLRGVTPDASGRRLRAGLRHARRARRSGSSTISAIRRARILDGGFKAWTAAGQPVTTDVTAPVPSDWHGTPDPSRIATWRDVLDRLGQPDNGDRRHAQRRRVLRRAVRAKRGGAIPGAVHLEWTNNLTPDGRFKTADELRAMYAAAGITPDREVVTYCQGGYRAAHAYLALKLAGLSERAQLHRIVEGMGRSGGSAPRARRPVGAERGRAGCSRFLATC